MNQVEEQASTRTVTQDSAEEATEQEENENQMDDSRSK